MFQAQPSLSPREGARPHGALPSLEHAEGDDALSAAASSHTAARPAAAAEPQMEEDGAGPEDRLSSGRELYDNDTIAQLDGMLERERVQQDREHRRAAKRTQERAAGPSPYGGGTAHRQQPQPSAARASAVAQP